MTGPPNGTDQRRTGTVEINGANLWHEVAGSGPGLVLLHAGIADARMWDGHFNRYADHYRVLRYDLRGYGRSTLPGGPFSMVGDLKDLLGHLGMTNVALIGCSLGGQIALEFTLEYPLSIGALVLVAPALDDHEWSDEIKHAEELEEDAFDRGDAQEVAELNLRTWLDGPGRGPDAVPQEVRERIRSMQLASFWTQHEALASDPPPGPGERLDPPAGTRLSEISVPTLVLVGAEDVPDMLRIADRLEQNLLRCEKIVMEGVAHLPNMEQPRMFDQIVLTFLARAFLDADPDGDRRKRML